MIDAEKKELSQNQFKPNLLEFLPLIWTLFLVSKIRISKIIIHFCMIENSKKIQLARHIGFNRKYIVKLMNLTMLLIETKKIYLI